VHISGGSHTMGSCCFHKFSLSAWLCFLIWQNKPLAAQGGLLALCGDSVRCGVVVCWVTASADRAEALKDIEPEN